MFFCLPDVQHYFIKTDGVFFQPIALFSQPTDHSRKTYKNDYIDEERFFYPIQFFAVEFITPFRLTKPDRLSSLVEHRNRFCLDFCELNVFETHQQAQDFRLKFSDFAITSMLRGKKVMKLEGLPEFDYVPGETVLAPPNTLMRIDFPEADLQRPTQCTALVIDGRYLQRQLASINELFGQEEKKEWQISPKELMLKNSAVLTSLSNRMLHVFASDDPFKEYQVDLLLRELFLSLLKLQNLTGLKKEYKQLNNSSPFHAVLHYISNKLGSEIRIEELCRIAGMSKSSFYRAFTEAYGISPGQLILEERIKYAKELLKENEISIKEVAYAAGFNDPNYFSRMFRKLEGKAPSMFREAIPENKG